MRYNRENLSEVIALRAVKPRWPNEITSRASFRLLNERRRTPIAHSQPFEERGSLEVFCRLALYRFTATPMLTFNLTYLPHVEILIPGCDWVHHTT